jgi:predicted amidohydrolase YtcJ
MDADDSVCQAVAIKDGRFLVVGGNDEISSLAGAATQKVNLRDRAAIPGLFDSHAHMLEVGLKLSAVRLDECRSSEEMMVLVKEKAAYTPAGSWIVGMGWNEGNFQDGRPPSRYDIDPATGDHPVLLQRFFNADVVNSVALRLAGISRNTPDPVGGRIVRDENGEPTGLFRASAKQLVRDIVPGHTLQELKKALILGCQEFNGFGITSVIDPGLTPVELSAYQSVYRDGKLTVRSNVMPSWHGFRDDESEAELNGRALGLGVCSGLGDEWLRLGGLKMAIDGGTTSHTAYMYEPFEGDSEVVNYNRLDTSELRKYFRIAMEHDWDIGIHVCGDRATDMAVDAFAHVAGIISGAASRNNLIHAYFPSDRAINLMAEHEIAAVVQPTFLYWEGDQLFDDVGRRRAANYKPVRKLLDRGVTVTASSDVPSTVSANPFIALYALVTRHNNLGHAVARDQAVSRREALRLYSSAGTWLTREEHLKGTIEPGKLADITVLDRDYFEIPSPEIKDVQTLMTVVGGQLVFDNMSGAE